MCLQWKNTYLHDCAYQAIKPKNVSPNVKAQLMMVPISTRRVGPTNSTPVNNKIIALLHVNNNNRFYFQNKNHKEFT